MISVQDLVRNYKQNVVQVIDYSLVGTAAATAANYPENLFIAPSGTLVPAFRLIAVTASWTAASTSGTLQVRKMASGVAIGSGTDLLASTIDMSATANTPVQGTLITNQATLIIKPTERIGLVAAGNPANQTGFGISLYLLPVNIEGLSGI